LEEDPSAATAEYLAEFRADIESFISKEALDAVTNWRALELPPLPGRRYEGFVDPSGGSNDSFTLTIAHKDDDVAVLDVARERRPPFSPEAVVTEFAEVLKSYRVTKIRGDRYAGEWCREAFRKHGISYDPATAPKSELYGNLLPLLNSGRVKLLNNKRLLTQLAQLERRTSRAGRDSIDHAPGGHDDLANACAGVLVTVMEKKPQGRMGAIGVDGRIFWHDAEPEPLRLRYITVHPDGTETSELRLLPRDPKFIQRGR
jgi:hypothetical protein